MSSPEKPWQFLERLSVRKRLVVFLLMMGPLSLYFAVPIVYVFFSNDLAYRQVLSRPVTGTSLSADLRAAAAKLDLNEKLACHPRDADDEEAGLSPERQRYEAAFGFRQPLDRIFDVIHWMQGASAGRQPMLGHIDLYFKAEHWKLPILRRGFEVSDQTGTWETAYDKWKMGKIDSFCKAQQEHAEYGEPFDAPIAVNGELRDLLLRAADRTDVAVARYRAARVPLAILIGLLMAYPLASAGCYVWLVRSFLRERAERRAGART